MAKQKPKRLWQQAGRELWLTAYLVGARDDAQYRFENERTKRYKAEREYEDFKRHVESQRWQAESKLQRLTEDRDGWRRAHDELDSKRQLVIVAMGGKL